MFFAVVLALFLIHFLDIVSSKRKSSESKQSDKIQALVDQVRVPSFLLSLLFSYSHQDIAQMRAMLREKKDDEEDELNVTFNAKPGTGPSPRTEHSNRGMFICPCVCLFLTSLFQPRGSCISSCGGSSSTRVRKEVVIWRK